MATSLRAFGDVIRSFRIEKKLSQRELAAAISQKTSRSAIAHLEQGLRLPNSQVLSATCVHLGVPKPVWEPFLGRTREANVAPNLPVDLLPQFIAVAGINGSGKSTLVNQLANMLGYAQLPEATPGIAYLSDLATDPQRWAFEAQLAFLSHKALQLRALLDRGARVVVDRSISEDIRIFAVYWRVRGAISDRAYSTYLALAKHFQEILPVPDLVIYCQCSAAVGAARVQSRGRGDPLHTPAHLADLHQRYAKWISEYCDGEIYVVNTETHDLRRAEVTQAIANDIRFVFQSEPRAADQLDLFDTSAAPTPGATRRSILEEVSTEPSHKRKESAAVMQPYRGPVLAYLAAPFTSVAQASASTRLSPSPDPSALFADVAPHGIIERGRFRNTLLSVERSLRRYGMTTWIPHRDTNRWGKRVMTAGQVALECTHQVYASDLLICLLGTSAGAHYELGVARGVGKPVVILACRELTSSFIGHGIEQGDWPDTLVLRAERMKDIGGLLRHTDFYNFVVRYLPINVAHASK